MRLADSPQAQLYELDNLTNFKIIQGGRDKQATINNVDLAVVPDTLSPLPVKARVYEEDTHMVLTVDPDRPMQREHPIRVMTGIMETKPRRPGSIITNNDKWYAIVHDLDAEPAWQKEWTGAAYLAILRLAEAKHVHKLGLPLLGSVYGPCTPEQSLEILLRTIKALSFHHLKKILLLLPPDDCTKIKNRLKNM